MAIVETLWDSHIVQSLHNNVFELTLGRGAGSWPSVPWTTCSEGRESETKNALRGKTRKKNAVSPFVILPRDIHFFPLESGLLKNIKQRLHERMNARTPTYSHVCMHAQEEGGAASHLHKQQWRQVVEQDREKAKARDHEQRANQTRRQSLQPVTHTWETRRERASDGSGRAVAFGARTARQVRSTTAQVRTAATAPPSSILHGVKESYCVHLAAGAMSVSNAACKHESFDEIAGPKGQVPFSSLETKTVGRKSPIRTGNSSGRSVHTSQLHDWTVTGLQRHHRSCASSPTKHRAGSRLCHPDLISV